VLFIIVYQPLLAIGNIEKPNHGPACVVSGAVCQPSVTKKSSLQRRPKFINQSNHAIMSSYHKLRLECSTKGSPSRQEKSARSAQGLGCRLKSGRRFVQAVRRTADLCTGRRQLWGFRRHFRRHSFHHQGFHRLGRRSRRGWEGRSRSSRILWLLRTELSC
jgi:hypothetical protein